MLTLNNGSRTAYKTNKLAELLEVSTSSIRKYAATIESHGATFMTDDKGQRLFTDSDLSAFRHMRALITGGKTMEQAGSLTATLLKNEKSVKSEIGEVMQQNDRTLFKEMANQIKVLTQQNEQMATVIIEMDKKQSHILAALNRLESLEVARLEEVAMVIEVSGGETEEKPKGFFARLFK